ncbi:metal ABC transporter permease [Kineosporia babensis]|uniref:Metal ABC transporter permease n=1 Tax=Kineosporia babensis TaxID=499548 RepID=A0A9X1NI86_9ACTN|nr:metal ABC transporter permease [Kineosporia babensis]
MSWDKIFNFTDYSELLPLVHNSLLAGLILGLVGGLISTFVVMRDLPFAVHGISELSFAGASGFLLLGLNVVAGSLLGSVLAALLIGLLGVRARDRNSWIGVLMPFGLGLGVLFLALYEGRAANKFGLLTGQIVAIDTPALSWLAVISAVVAVVMLLIWRPLSFASTDPEVAQARGIPMGPLALLFMLLLGLVVAMAVQVVGALLVLSIVVTPGAAAVRLASTTLGATVLSICFATVSMIGGILLALGSSVPISPYVTTISFAIYLLCRLIAMGKGRSRAV